MTYRIVHKTIYKYKVPVSVGNHIAYLTPRTLAHHTCTSHELSVTPAPSGLSERLDFFGNPVTFFSIREPHDELHIEARSRVVIDDDPAAWPEHSPPWEEVARSLPADSSPEGLDAYQFVFESPRIRPGAEFKEYAAPSFPPARPLAEALLDLTGRIHKDFRFDSKATNVRTAPEEVLRLGRGVCQDFAHLQVACLRSLGLAGQVCERIPADLPSTWTRPAGGSGCFARLDLCLLPRRRLAGCGSDQQHDPVPESRYALLGPGLRRCQPGARRNPRRSRP